LCDLETYETVFPTLPGSVTRPVPGFEVRVVDDEGNDVEKEKPPELVASAFSATSKIGKVLIKRPLPPGSMVDMVGDGKDAALKACFEDVPEYFSTGDSGLIDENGYLKLAGRTEDIITLQNGDKVPSAAFEDSINEREEVVESAVVAYQSKERGEAPLAFVVLRGPPYDEEKLTLEKPESEVQEEEAKAGREIRKNVNTDCGENARLVGIIFVACLPKTRSGHVLRKALKDIAAGGAVDGDDHPMILNLARLENCKECFEKWTEPTAAEEGVLSEKSKKNRGCC
jgi:propionyl-CoA synthetase